MFHPASKVYWFAAQSSPNNTFFQSVGLFSRVEASREEEHCGEQFDIPQLGADLVILRDQ